MSSSDHQTAASSSAQPDAEDDVSFNSLPIMGMTISHMRHQYTIGERIAKGTFCNIHAIKPDGVIESSQAQPLQLRGGIDGLGSIRRVESQPTSQDFVLKVFQNGRQFRRTVRAIKSVDSLQLPAEQRNRIEQVVGHNSLTLFVELPRKKQTEPRYSFITIPYVIMPQYDMRLKDFIKHHVEQYESGLPALATLTITRQLFQALDYLERAGVVHGDIKPGNILLRGNPLFDEHSITHFDTVLCDFGSARLLDSKTRTCGPACVGTDGFIAPEIMLGREYTPRADIWSAMISVFYVITGDYLFDVFDTSDLEYGINMSGISVHAPTDETEDASIPSDVIDDGHDDDSGTDYDDVTDDIDFPTLYAHIVLMYRLLGKPPEAFCNLASEFYNNGIPRYHLSLNPGTILQFFSANYHNLNRNAMQQVEEFLLLGLQYLESDRNPASIILSHSFLNPVTPGSGPTVATVAVASSGQSSGAPKTGGTKNKKKKH